MYTVLYTMHICDRFVFYLQRWPSDHCLHVWMAGEGWATESSIGGDPPGVVLQDNGSGTSSHGDGSHVTRTSNPVLGGFTMLRYASCAQQTEQFESGSSADVRLTSLADNVQGHPQWSHRRFDVIGFDLSLTSTQSFTTPPLSLSMWSNTVTKGSFMKYG